MSELRKKIHDDNNGLDYVLVGDYYLPVLSLPEETRPIGCWGMLRKEYLKEHKSGMYSCLLLTARLDSHLADVNEQAQERFELIEAQMRSAEGVTEDLLSNECKAAPDMTHGLKNIGDGDMKEGMKIMVDFFEENGMRKGALLGATATLAGVGLIVGAKKLYSMKKVHKEKGEKILNGLKQGIENELTESIEDYECTKESEKAENIQADNV